MARMQYFKRGEVLAAARLNRLVDVAYDASSRREIGLPRQVDNPIVADQASAAGGVAQETERTVHLVDLPILDPTDPETTIGTVTVEIIDRITFAWPDGTMITLALDEDEDGDV